MRSLARSLIAIFLVIGLLDLPSFAATNKPLGFVVQAQSALLANAIVSVGTTVYPGDMVTTDEGGTLRLKFGTTQLYLLSSSAATFSQKGDIIRATVSRGTVGLSSTDTGNVELEVPEGILRAANGQPTYGQVTISGPQEVVISAYRGALILDNEGELHTIPAGKTYRVTMELELAAQPASPGGASQDKARDNGVIPTRRRRLAFDLLLAGGVAVGSYFIWRVVTESPSQPN